MLTQLRGYIFSRKFMDERAPQHVQNIVIRDYCQRHGFKYQLSATEYAMPNCHLILKQVISELNDKTGIVAYSVFQLPETDSIREKIIDDILSLNSEIHFAVENLKVLDQKTKNDINLLWKIKKAEQFCIKSF